MPFCGQWRHHDDVILLFLLNIRTTSWNCHEILLVIVSGHQTATFEHNIMSLHRTFVLQFPFLSIFGIYDVITSEFQKNIKKVILKKNFMYVDLHQHVHLSNTFLKQPKFKTEPTHIKAYLKLYLNPALMQLSYKVWQSFKGPFNVLPAIKISSLFIVTFF